MYDYAEEFNRASADVEEAPRVVSKFAPPPPERKPATVVPAKKPEPVAAAVHIEKSDNLPDWSVIVKKLHVSGRTKQLAEKSELLIFDDIRIELRCGIRTLATNQSANKELEKAIHNLYGDNRKKLKIHVGEATNSPAKIQAAAHAEQLSVAENLIANDATIQALVREFDGMILPSSIKAL
ncbi:MAG: DNA polymerase III subunit gamma/tau C-terminal domain-containing protein [Formosimonas sp.]